MPIEIKELHIRVAVNTSPSGQSSGGYLAAGTANESEGNSGGTDSIVAECVEQVLQVLKNKLER